MNSVLLLGLTVLAFGQEPLAPPPMRHGEYPDELTSRYAFSCRGSSYEIVLANTAHEGPELVDIDVESEVIEADLRREISDAIADFDQVWGLGFICSNATVTVKILGPKRPWFETVREEEVFVRTRDYSDVAR